MSQYRTSYYQDTVSGKYYNLNKVVWDIGFKGNPNHEVVPANTPFDVTIPWFLGWVWDRDNPQYFLAALLHDYLLSIGYDRVTAAGAFNHGLRAEGVPFSTRLVMTLGVALFKFS